MKNFLTNYKEVLVMGLVTLALSLSGLWATGGITNSIYPAIADDDTYYLARVNTVHNGYPNIGSPYYFEHRLDEALAFTLPDIISSFPLFIGLSMNQTIVFNFVFWSEIFCLLMWLILLKLNFSKKHAVVGTIFIYLQVYWMIMRPVILQVVWPILLLFILGVIIFEKQGRDKLGLSLIVISTALSFYFYSFLSQFIVIILFILAAYHLYQKEKDNFWKIIIAGLIAFLLVIPELINQYKHFLDPIYWQTFSRLGLVDSHFPNIYQYNYGRWVLFAIPVWYLLRRKITEDKVIDIFVYVFGFSLVVLTWSNLFTGKDYYLGTHVGLFVTLYIAVMGVLLPRMMIKGRSSFMENRWWIKLAIAFLLLALSANLASNFQRSLPYREVFRKDLIKYQKVEGVINWIRLSGEKSKVVLADDNLATYIGMYTNFYSVFSKYGLLGMMTSSESADRYLVSRSLQKNISNEQLINELSINAGLGETTRLDSLNSKNRWCKKYKLDVFFGMFCYPELSVFDYKGNDYWSDLSEKWSFNKTNLQSKLTEYSVKYLAWPKDRVGEVDLSKLSLKVVYEDEYYTVYELLKK